MEPMTWGGLFTYSSINGDSSEPHTTLDFEDVTLIKHFEDIHEDLKYGTKFELAILFVQEGYIQFYKSMDDDPISYTIE